ncbi:NAD(P)H-binding protein [Actinosynnema sp. NPDC049800]
MRRLLDAGRPVRALTRDPAAARLPAAVEVVAGDFTDPASLSAALRGVERVHLVSMEGDGPAIVDALVGAGVRRLTHLGHNDPSRSDDDPLESWHRVFHRAIESSGMEWTHLFPGEFMANTREWAPSIRDEGVVRAPFGDWHSAMVNEDDIAAIAVTALVEDGREGGPTSRPGRPPCVGGTRCG